MFGFDQVLFCIHWLHFFRIIPLLLFILIILHPLVNIYKCSIFSLHFLHFVLPLQVSGFPPVRHATACSPASCYWHLLSFLTPASCMIPCIMLLTLAVLHDPLHHVWSPASCHLHLLSCMIPCIMLLTLAVLHDPLHHVTDTSCPAWSPASCYWHLLSCMIPCIMSLTLAVLHDPCTMLLTPAVHDKAILVISHFHSPSRVYKWRASIWSHRKIVIKNKLG